MYLTQTRNRLEREFWAVVELSGIAIAQAHLKPGFDPKIVWTIWKRNSRSMVSKSPSQYILYLIEEHGET